MSNPTTISLQLPAAVANGVALSQTPGGARNLTLSGSLATAGVANLVVAQRVGVTSSGNDATVVFTIYGTDREGNVINEAITGVNTATVFTQRNFLTVTRVAVSAGTAGAITVGTVGVGSTPWQLFDMMIAPFFVSQAGRLVSGTATFTFEHTYDDPNAAIYGTIAPQSNQPPWAWPDATLANVATSGESPLTQTCFAGRFTINSGTGVVQGQWIQAGISNV